MTDKQTPTDAELKDMWQLHAADIGGVFHYARAVLAKWGTPVGAGEPFGYFHQLLNHEGKGNGVWLGAAERKVVEQAHTPGETSEEIVVLYTTPQPTQTQPVAREQLTPERVKEIVRGAGYDQCGIPDTERAAFINGLRHVERAHGIKGGQHVS